MGRKDDRAKRKQATFRTGVGGFPGWSGMDLEGDPGGSPPNKPAHLENVTFRGGSLQRRAQAHPKFSPATSGTYIHADDAKVVLQDFQSRSKKLMLCTDGCPGIDPTVGQSVNYYDHEQSPKFSSGNYYNTANGLVIGKFGGGLYVGVDDALRRYVTILPPYGQQGVSIAGTYQDIPLYTFTGFVVSCLMEFDGKLFVGLDAGAGASAVWTWDSLAAREDLTACDTPTVMCRFRDKLVMGFDTSKLRYRVAGDSPGTWTVVNESASTLQAVQMVEYKDNLYISEGGSDIWKYDGTTLSIVHALPVGATENFALGVFGGYLFFGWTSSLGVVTLGRFDGTTWTDSHKSFTSFLADAQWIRQLIEYRGDLWAGVYATSGFRMYRSPGTATTGTWVMTTTPAVSFGDVNQALVY